MKTILVLSACCHLLVSILLCKEADATAYATAFATVKQINTFSSSPIGYTPATNRTWFSLNLSSQSLGSCAATGGTLAFVIKDTDKNILSVVTAAFLAGKSISVTVNDTAQPSANCPSPSTPNPNPALYGKDCSSFCYAQIVQMN